MVDLNKLQNRWNVINSSYWYIPSILCIFAVLLFFVFNHIDTYHSIEYYTNVGAVRNFLTVIAGSVIGVAGTVFSITIAAVSFTASQYGPRILNNFTDDRPNQFVIGIFLSVFVYCITALQFLHGDITNLAIPQLPILFVYPLAVISIAALTYFIHHVPSNLRVSKIIHSIGEELIDHIANIRFDRISYRDLKEADEEKTTYQEQSDHTIYILNDTDGYIQDIQIGELFDICIEHDITYFLKGRTGDFKSKGMPIGYVYSEKKVTKEIADKIRSQYTFSVHRNKVSDILFYLDELIEIAARALSPGINDPYTAMNCMDWIGSFLIHAIEKELPSRYHYDSDEKLRVVTFQLEYEDLMERAIDGLRPYVVNDKKSVVHLLEILQMVGESVEDPDRLDVLKMYVNKICDDAEDKSAFNIERDELDTLRSETLELLS